MMLWGSRLSSLRSPPQVSTGPACHVHHILTSSRKQRQRKRRASFPHMSMASRNQYFSESSRRLSFTWPWTELDVLPAFQNKFYRQGQVRHQDGFIPALCSGTFYDDEMYSTSACCMVATNHVCQLRSWKVIDVMKSWIFNFVYFSWM